MTTTQSDPSTGRRSALYTPEAVRVDLPLADVGSRTLSILIDLFVMFVLLYLVLLLAIAAVGVAFSEFDGGPGWVIIVVVLLLNFLVLWGYPVGTETLLKGRTPGKAAMGLRVVTVDGAPVRFRHAAIRGLFAFIDFYLFFGVPALVTALVTRRGQRLGDLAAGTVIVRDRSAQSGGDQAVFWQVPSGLQAYASTLDVRGLTAADYAVVRRFLLRAGSLKPQHRQRIATDLANVLADRMSHRPPPGIHPEAMLLCTAALLQGVASPPPRPAAPPPPAGSQRGLVPNAPVRPSAPAGSGEGGQVPAAPTGPFAPPQ